MSVLTIALLEDEPVIARDLQETLEHSGFRLFCAENIAELLDFCQSEHPDLVLVNFYLEEGGNSLSVCRFVENQLGIRTALITGAYRGELSNAPHDQAHSLVLYKPFNGWQLIEFLQHLFRRLPGSA